MKQKPVKHLADCNACFVPKDGHRVRDKSICQKCPAYNKCVAKKTDKIMGEVLRNINKLHIFK